MGWGGVGWSGVEWGEVGWDGMAGWDGWVQWWGRVMVRLVWWRGGMLVRRGRLVRRAGVASRGRGTVAQVVQALARSLAHSPASCTFQCGGRSSEASVAGRRDGTSRTEAAHHHPLAPPPRHPPPAPPPPPPPLPRRPPRPPPPPSRHPPCSTALRCPCALAPSHRPTPSTRQAVSQVYSERLFKWLGRPPRRGAGAHRSRERQRWGRYSKKASANTCNGSQIAMRFSALPPRDAAPRRGVAAASLLRRRPWQASPFASAPREQRRVGAHPAVGVARPRPPGRAPAQAGRRVARTVESNATARRDRRLHHAFALGARGGPSRQDLPADAAQPGGVRGGVGARVSEGDQGDPTTRTRSTNDRPHTHSTPPHRPLSLAAGATSWPSSRPTRWRISTTSHLPRC